METIDHEPSRDDSEVEITFARSDASKSHLRSRVLCLDSTTGSKNPHCRLNTNTPTHSLTNANSA